MNSIKVLEKEKPFSYQNKLLNEICKIQEQIKGKKDIYIFPKYKYLLDRDMEEIYKEYKKCLTSSYKKTNILRIMKLKKIRYYNVSYNIEL